MQLYNFEGGQIWLDTSDEMQRLMAETRWEWRKVGYMHTYLHPGNTFVDVGAYNGYFTLLAARMVQPGGYVVSCEAHSGNFSLLKRNAGQNSLENWLGWPLAISSEDGTATFYESKTAGWSSLKDVRPNTYPTYVQTRTLDSVTYGRPVEMIKIDVEGAEFEVLQGAEKTLAISPHISILLDLHPELGARPEPVEQFLLERGFRLFDIRTNFARIDHIPATLVELLAVK